MKPVDDTMEDIDNQLLPCPFCGSKAKIFGQYLKYYVTCTNFDCMCSLGESYYKDMLPDHRFYTKLLALKAWNTRV